MFRVGERPHGRTKQQNPRRKVTELFNVVDDVVNAFHVNKSGQSKWFYNEQ